MEKKGAKPDVILQWMLKLVPADKLIRVAKETANTNSEEAGDLQDPPKFGGGPRKPKKPANAATSTAAPKPRRPPRPGLPGGQSARQRPEQAVP